MFEVELRNVDEAEDNSKNLANERLGVLRKVVEGLADIVDQVEIKCTSKGLSVQAMDPMHVALADVYFSMNSFTNYRCDRDIQLGIPTKNFLLILKGIVLDSTSIFRLSCEDSAQTLKIEHIQPHSQSTYDITLYNIGTESYTIPELEYNSSIAMPSEQFRAVFKPMGAPPCEYIKFECNDSSLVLRQNSDLIKNSVSLISDKKRAIKIDSKAQVDLEIAMKYVTLVNKISVLSDDVKINLTNASPVLFEVDFNNNDYIKFYVMPRAD